MRRGPAGAAPAGIRRDVVRGCRGHPDTRLPRCDFEVSNGFTRLGPSAGGEPRVNRLNDNRSLTDCRGNPLHGARADVAHRKNARQAGLKSVEGDRRIRPTVLSGEDEAAVIEPYGLLYPLGAGAGTDHDEDAADAVLRHVSCTVAGLYPSEML